MSVKDTFPPRTRKWVMCHGSSKGLLSMSDLMGCHSYMEQVVVESSHGVFLLRKWNMNMNMLHELWPMTSQEDLLSVSKVMGLDLCITQVSFEGYSCMWYNNIMIMS